jgi:tRNA 2-thiouridine synthesizing protein E
MLEHEGIKVAVDAQGYLVNFEEWNEGIASLLAVQEGVGELTSDRLDIIRFMRTYYREHHFFPIIRSICKKAHQPKECFTEQFINPVKAWKIAGLPNPGDEVEMFKSWEPLGF